ncbi:N-acetylmuramoyl-L-alanine amidase [Nocardia colli]|uniref:N-acetylmuramoyl-L-alanine amidase n=1 Tax=Nocardia colli TaxID=2545717 RepID=UPI00295F0F77|nr:N-acetylmuramoyl-L-alanine amidase [Nocardia colli]
MPYRKPKRSYVLPVVTTLAVAAPLAALTMSDSPDYRATTGTELAAVPAQLAEVVLNLAPDIVLPLRELTGLDLPDLHLSDLRMLPLPASIPIPDGLPLPPGVQLPKEIPLPKLNGPHPATPGQQSAPGLNTAPGSNATPGQGLAPGQTPFPGQATAPTQNSFPGQAVTPNQNNIPGRTAPNNSPGQAAAPTQNSIPGQAIAPGQNTNPGQAAGPAQNSIPGQAAAPAPNTNPGQAAVPGQNTNPGQASTPVQNPVPGQVAAPGQMPNSGQTAPTPAQSAPGGARFIADPSRLEPGTTPDTPALAPGAVPPELTDQVGAQVKELSRETPFSVVALTAADLTNTKAMLRARQSDGSWGPWFNAEPVDTRRTDRAAAGGKTGTEPLYVGTTNAVQMLVTRKNAAATAPDPADRPAPRSDDPAQMSGVDLTAVLIDPGRGAIDGALHKVAAPAPGGGPKVISREGWGADESIRCEEPTYDDGPGKDGLGGITVHHTAGRNDYTEEESAGIVRAIYTYHAKTLGWCDIGYNALVDKYGQIFEGRAGGLDRAVQGAHAGGFNENTAGVALMGNYTQDPPTEESIEAIGNFIGWRAKIAHLNPQGKTTMYSEGTEYTSYAMGQAVNLPIVFAHRDVGNTTCPGDAAYEQMDRIREIAASVAGGSGVTSSGTGNGTDSNANNGTGTDGAANSPAPQAAPRNKPDLSALAALTKKLLGMVNENPIAKHWADNGGPRGPLGAAQTEPLPAAQGQQYAKFANGYVYTAPDGKVIEVLGKILDRFLQLGGDAGVLGLPTSDAYNVPNGQRADFQYGSLILNQVTGIVTTVWKTYNDTYQQDGGRPAPAAAPGPAPAPAAAPGPAPAPAPAESSTPAEVPAPAEPPAPAPQPDALQFPAPEDFLPTPAPEPAG